MKEWLRKKWIHDPCSVQVLAHISADLLLLNQINGHQTNAQKTAAKSPRRSRGSPKLRLDLYSACLNTLCLTKLVDLISHSFLILVVFPYFKTGQLPFSQHLAAFILCPRILAAYTLPMFLLPMVRIRVQNNNMFLD